MSQQETTKKNGTWSQGFNVTVNKLSVRKVHTQHQRKHETSDKQGTVTTPEEHKHGGKDNQCTEATLKDSDKPQDATKSRTTHGPVTGQTATAGARQTKR